MVRRIRSQIARGSAELAILSLLAEQPLYGFEISKRIDEKSGGALRFAITACNWVLVPGVALVLGALPFLGARPPAEPEGC